MKNHIEIIAFMKFLETCWFIYVSVNNAHNWWQNLDTFQFTEISPGNVIKSGLLYHQDSFLLETQLWHPDWTFCFVDGFHQAGARKHWSSYNTGKFVFFLIMFYTFNMMLAFWKCLIMERPSKWMFIHLIRIINRMLINDTVWLTLLVYY